MKLKNQIFKEYMHGAAEIIDSEINWLETMIEVLTESGSIDQAKNLPDIEKLKEAAETIRAIKTWLGSESVLRTMSANTIDCLKSKVQYEKTLSAAFEQSAKTYDAQMAAKRAEDLEEALKLLRRYAAIV